MVSQMKQREIDRLYKEKMISGGYCPKCGDFLIPRKRTKYVMGTNLNTGVSLECINPKCDYEIDLGDDAQVTERKTEADNPINSKLLPKNGINYRNALGAFMSIGQMKRSLPKTVKKSSIIDMDRIDQEGKLVIVEYFDEKNELRREFLDEIRIVDE